MNMSRQTLKRVTRSFFAAVLLAGSVFAQAIATTPTPRTDKVAWMQKVERDIARAKQGGWELVLIGDSITQGWLSTGKEVWDRHFSSYKTLNLGIVADKTENVLWRLDQGQLEGYQPRLFVVLIGTNNTGHRTAAQESTADTVAGVRAILERIRQKAPQSHVLLLALFPRGETPQDARRLRNEAVNNELKSLAAEMRISWLNINDKFLQADGTLTREIMPDLLHPNAKGYEIWAEAMLPTVRKLIDK